MTSPFTRFAAVAAVLIGASRAAAEATVVVNVNRGAAATADFAFADVPAPSRTDAANAARFTLLDGARDRNGAELSSLNDGLLPATADEPDANVFFAAGTPGGRLLVDLGRPVAVRRVATYSWHPAERGPQVYKLYGAAATGADFDATAAGRRTPLDEATWTLLADVDSRGDDDGDESQGGQFGVAIIAPADEPLGEFRYLLFAVARTGLDERFDNTFYSEIDVDDGQEHPAAARPPREVDVVKIGDDYEIAFDASQTPELQDWVQDTLQPICIEWYPRIVDMLPSAGYAAPRRFTITFEPDMQGVAYTAGRRVVCAEPWFRDNLDGEAAGAVVHELVHVVQQYGRRRGGERNPGWLVEGLADYIRWFLYEPEDLRPLPNPDRAHYTDSYRTTGAFLNYVVGAHGEDCIPKLNAAMRDGAYTDDLWTELTGKSADELWADYVRTLRK